MNKQTGKKEDKEQPCHWALLRFNVHKVLPSFSTSITRISLSLSTLISVQRHSDKTRGSSVWLWVFISIHPIVFIHLCENIYVLLWRHLGAYVCKDSDTRSFCDLHLRPICCFSTCSQWVQFWLSLKRDVQWFFLSTWNPALGHINKTNYFCNSSLCTCIHSHLLQ